MPVETSWYIEKRVCLQRVYGDVTLAQILQAVDDAAVWTAKSSPPVYFIIEIRAVKSYPPLPMIMRVMPRSSPANVEWSVLVVVDPTLRFMATLLTRFARMRYHTVSSIEQAGEYLKGIDATLVLPNR
ncbi:MAG: hypothetical protein U0694_06065 [Anaerolineae bacterium]